MSTNFARALSLLRQEKQVSQRIAAQELGISQALLSHYENGIREPGLAFVLRACDYYQVSADFLLGRTLSRDGTVILDADTLSDSSRETTQETTGHATLPKKLVVNAVDLLFNLLEETGRVDAIQAAGNYMSAGVYTLFRYLHRADHRHSEDMFSVPHIAFLYGAAKMDLLASELAYTEALMDHAEKRGAFPDLSDEALRRQGDRYQSLLQIIHTTGKRVNQYLTKAQEDMTETVR